jgi:hypothetical protein
MTEAEWNACTDPEPMLEFLRATHGASKRRLRLFAVACVRRIWHLLEDERSHKAVEVAERFADRMATQKELLSAVYPAREATNSPVGNRSATGAAAWAADPEAPTAAENASWAAAAAVAVAFPWKADPKARLGTRAWEQDPAAALRRSEELNRQSQLLRDILGNPFRPATINFRCLLWNGGAVVRLAQAVYDDRRFGDLPILADALEAAGCTDPTILGHCRSGGEHFRGCWVVDLLLGRG